MKTFLLLFAFPFVLATFSPAQQASDAEAKLREALRTTVLQLRTAQAEQARLEAAQVQSEATIAEQTATVEKMTKQAAADRTESRAEIERLTARGEELERETARLQESLAKWKEGYAKAAKAAQAKTVESAKLGDERAILEARLRDYKAKNLALFTTANEILTRYENHSTGKAIAAREPFTGIARARLETLVQDYRDKIEAERIRPATKP